MGLKLGLLVLSVVALVCGGGVSKSVELCLVAVVEDIDFFGDGVWRNLELRWNDMLAANSATLVWCGCWVADLSVGEMTDCFCAAGPLVGQMAVIFGGFWAVEPLIEKLALICLAKPLVDEMAAIFVSEPPVDEMEISLIFGVANRLALRIGAYMHCNASMHPLRDRWVVVWWLLGQNGFG